MIDRAKRRSRIAERTKVVRLRRFKRRRGPKPKPLDADIGGDQAGAPADDLPGMADPIIRSRGPAPARAFEEPSAETPIDALFDTTEDEIDR